MDINRRNLEDFTDMLNKHKNIVGRNSFRDMTIEDLEYLFDWWQDIIDEWQHLESDIDDWLDILYNIEEK
jgi:hypothetical protein